MLEDIGERSTVLVDNMTFTDDTCIRTGRLARIAPGRLCCIDTLSGHLICPGECEYAKYGYEIEIARSEQINRGIRESLGWTRGTGI